MISFPRLIVTSVVCAAAVPLLCAAAPGPVATTTISEWPETGLVEKFPETGPKVLWRTPVANGYAGAAYDAGKVYVMDYEIKKGEVTASFMARSELSGRERVHCLDAATGKILWTHAYDCAVNLSYPNGPRCTPAVADGKVVTLGAEGMLKCLNTADGKVLWQADLKQQGIVGDSGERESPFWGYAAHPLVHEGKIYTLAGGDGRVAVAHDLQSGKELWHSLKGPQPGYAPPVLISSGGQAQLLVWHPAALSALNPSDGKELWSLPMEPAYGMSIMAPAVIGDRVFVSSEGRKSMLAKLVPGKPAEILWENVKGAIHAKNGTPIHHAGYLYGSDAGGALLCSRVEDGVKMWETLDLLGKPRKESSATIHLVRLSAHPEKDGAARWVLFNDSGELILADLSPKGFNLVSRAKVIEPTTISMGAGSRLVAWALPAYGGKCVFLRNDKELVCVSMAQ